MRIPPETQRLLLPSEVQALFGVGPVALCRWGNSGRMPYVTTPGGNRRYREAEVLALLRAGDTSMIVPLGAVGGEALAPGEAQERPATGVPPAEALAGRNGTGTPGRFGGTVDGESPCHPAPRTESRQR